MRRWNSALSSLSSSSSPSSSADDNYFSNRTNGGRMPDDISLFSSPFPAGSYHRRGVTSSRNYQHLTYDDVVHAPSRSISTPPALPLPELPVLLKRDCHRESSVTQTPKYVLPSPEDATRKSVEKRGIFDANHGDSKRPPCLDRSLDTEHRESQFLQNWPRNCNFTDGPKHRKTHATWSGFNVPLLSAPTTPTSNRSLFPSTNKTDVPGIQVWSPPCVANHHHTIPDRSVQGFYGSPVYCPQTRTKSPISSSPFPNRSSIESAMSRLSCNPQATMASVHPLPLPPGASAIHPPSSSAPTNKKPHSVPKTPKQSQWQKGKLVGRGTFGSVYVGSNRETGALCAMKEVEILPDDPKSAESLKQLEQEIDVLSQLKHPNIVQYYGSEIIDDRFYIYLEYIHPGSINKYVRDHCGGMTESIVRNFTRHIVSGLAYLHSTKTIHREHIKWLFDMPLAGSNKRDIKGANLLVDANGVVKLADFGMAKNLSGQINLSLKGSPYWMAPELLQGETQKDSSSEIALAVDIWSLGCTIIEMINGKPPWSEYEGAAAMFKVIKETPPIPETMSPDGKSFLQCCFIRNPAERPTATMLLQHRFLNNSIG